jgi:hypothetical protein
LNEVLFRYGLVEQMLDSSVHISSIVWFDDFFRNSESKEAGTLWKVKSNNRSSSVANTWVLFFTPITSAPAYGKNCIKSKPTNYQIA